MITETHLAVIAAKVATGTEFMKKITAHTIIGMAPRASASFRIIADAMTSAVWRDKWETCSGSWISSSSPSTSVTALTEGMTAKMTSNGWLWSCKEGYALKSDKSGCMINPVNPCGTDGTKVLYKGQCYDKPASGYGFDYTPGTVSDAVIECSTKKLANGLVYQKLFDGYVCITCTGNFYIRNTEMWFENGNCGEVKKINQYKFTECAKKGLVDKDLENCLLN